VRIGPCESLRRKKSTIAKKRVVILEENNIYYEHSNEVVGVLISGAFTMMVEEAAVVDV
jgi:hypothetical protein